jgi:uncharacterized protein (UPF0276 family)
MRKRMVEHERKLKVSNNLEAQFQFENTSEFLAGVGLRPTHYAHLLKKPKTIVQWFEIMSENYMDTEGRPLHVLEKIRQDFPISFHGASLSIGSPDPINLNYLNALKKLIKRIDPFLVSDHFCWTGAQAENIHDLLPIPLDKMNLNRVIEKVNQVQDFLQKEILLENPSAYVSYQDSVIPEWEFNSEVARKTGCGLLLDINSVHVTCTNFGLDSYTYLDNIPSNKVGQIHLAGFTDMGSYLFDTHGEPVHQAVWDMYKYFIQKCPDVPVLIEWDQDIPEFPILEAELAKAIEIRNEFASLTEHKNEKQDPLKTALKREVK